MSFSSVAFVLLSWSFRMLTCSTSSVVCSRARPSGFCVPDFRVLTVVGSRMGDSGRSSAGAILRIQYEDKIVDNLICISDVEKNGLDVFFGN